MTVPTRFLADEQKMRVRIQASRRHRPELPDIGAAATNSPEMQLADEIAGAAAECWWSECWLGEPWQAAIGSGSVDHIDAHGQRHEIKQTSIGGGDLLVRHETPRNDIHHLVVGEIESGYHYIGSIDGIDISRFGRWENRNGKGSAWWVPQARLYRERCENSEANLDNAEVILKALRRVGVRVVKNTNGGWTIEGRENLDCRPALRNAANLYAREIAALIKEENTSC